jgi:hypothetical protein
VGQDKDNMDDVEDDLQGSFQESFGWFLVVNRICENDFTKHEYVYKKNITEVLNQLSYLISFDIEQRKLQKKMESSK